MRAPIFEEVKDDIEWPLEFTQPQRAESQESSDWLFDFLDEDIQQSLSNDNKDLPTAPSPPPPTTTTTSHEPSSTPKGFNNQISGIWLGSKGMPIPHFLKRENRVTPLFRKCYTFPFRFMAWVSCAGERKETSLHSISRPDRFAYPSQLDSQLSYHNSLA